MFRRTIHFTLIIILFFTCCTLHAQGNYHVVASYRGRNFSYVDGFGPLTTSNHISISATYDVPRKELIGNFFDKFEQYLTTWSMSDGVHTVSNTSSNISFSHRLVLELDANGRTFNVDQWQFHAETTNIRLGPSYISLYSVSGAISPNIGNDESKSTYPKGGNHAYTAFGSGGGKWSVTVSRHVSEDAEHFYDWLVG